MEQEISVKKKNNIILKAWSDILKLNDNKTLHEDKSIYHRRLLITVNEEKKYEAYDTSTDVYRPLNVSELNRLNLSDINDFCDHLFIKNCYLRIKNNRKGMQIAIAKNNQKNKNYHHTIAIQEIKTLRNFLHTNKKSSTFVNN
jgi:hypothetical protein